MQSLLVRRVSSSSSGLRRGVSRLAGAETFIGNSNAGLPKMPPFDYTPPPYDGPSADEVLRKRAQFLSPSLFHFYKKPLNIVDGKMQYLFDENGRRYLDAFGGIATISCSHCHHEVVKAVIE